MNRLFEPVRFDRKDIVWDYLIRTESDFKGYYHWHQCCEAVFVHEGQGSIVLNRQAYEIKRGMFFFFQPFQLHRVHAVVSPVTPYVRSIFYIDPNWIQRQLAVFPKKQALFSALWQGGERNHAYDLFQNAGVLEWTYESFNRCYTSGKGTQEDILLMIAQILNILDTENDDSKIKLTPEIRRHSRYSETVMRWIEEHYHEDVSLERLSEKTHLSTSYISRVFRQETGSNITDYLTARRMKQACRLLETTDLPIEEIGIRSGIPNTSYFIQLFKRVVGTTPLQYRKDRMTTHRTK
ncbi:AraC family transcriptional regulator [Paenibacillus sedimenti]|uniref:Helix-turn-helix transcriptional regulator n=1 Tax=Paenibacillus sedimenti TaxID=2770274 RepID=A0A926QJN6_9BACL|nr:AraC family transcriptional regulator [Paenibacillus sedimenti]MBD0380893.1 helix-turn-helix transcriptional regulator [Paenibacillus sedimenti]